MLAMLLCITAIMTSLCHTPPFGAPSSMGHAFCRDFATVNSIKPFDAEASMCKAVSCNARCKSWGSKQALHQQGFLSDNENMLEHLER